MKVAEGAFYLCGHSCITRVRCLVVSRIRGRCDRL
jgi:hypothetical protein